MITNTVPRCPNRLNPGRGNANWDGKVPHINPQTTYVAIQTFFLEYRPKNSKRSHILFDPEIFLDYEEGYFKSTQNYF